jgi:hypothetical protein
MFAEWPLAGVRLSQPHTGIDEIILWEFFAGGGVGERFSCKKEPSGLPIQKTDNVFNKPMPRYLHSPLTYR